MKNRCVNSSIDGSQIVANNENSSVWTQRIHERTNYKEATKGGKMRQKRIVAQKEKRTHTSLPAVGMSYKKVFDMPKKSDEYIDMTRKNSSRLQTKKSSFSTLDDLCSVCCYITPFDSQESGYECGCLVSGETEK